MQKVTLYVRPTKGNRTPQRVKSGDIYPMGTVYVLRLGSKWETVDCDNTSEARVAALRKEIELHTGKIEAPRPKRRPKVKDDGALDVLIDKYLGDGRATQRNWRKRTLWAYTQALRMFCQSCRKARLDDITGDDLREYVSFLRKYRTSTGKRYDDRSIWNHFNNVVTFLNAHGKRNLVEPRDWPKYEEKKTKCYDEADLARLLQCADEDEQDVLEFYLGVGFRNGEGEHIEWRDIDLRNKEVDTYSKRDTFGWEVKDSEERIVGISDRFG